MCLKIREENEEFFLLRRQLVEIQSNFGESIYAFFQFTRWLLMLNVVLSILFSTLIFPHIYDFSWSEHSFKNYVSIVFGDEYEHSWYFYGAYEPNYSVYSFNVGFIYVCACIASLFICIMAVIQRVLSDTFVQNDDTDYIYTTNVFSKYDFSLANKDAITLHQNSLMIRLHETLLTQLDQQLAVINCTVILKRLVGVLFTVVVGTISAAGIVLLIYFEHDWIIPEAKKIHPLAESLAPYIVPAGVAAIKAMTPKIVALIVSFESYTAEILFQQTFGRVMLLRMFAILVTLFQTSRKSEDLEELNSKLCAESQIGMVLYRFLLFDMAIEIFSYLVFPEMKYWVGRVTGRIKIKTDQQNLESLNATMIAAQSLENSPTADQEGNSVANDSVVDDDGEKYLLCLNTQQNAKTNMQSPWMSPVFDKKSGMKSPWMSPALDGDMRKSANNSQFAAKLYDVDSNERKKSSSSISKNVKKLKGHFAMAGDSWKSEFDITGSLVDVMYRQAIVWSGMYFSPMIPVMAVIATIVSFFLKERYVEYKHAFYMNVCLQKTFLNVIL